MNRFFTLIVMLGALIPFTGYSQNGRISGVVVDGDSKDLLVGATVIVEKADLPEGAAPVRRGSLTDLSGLYTCRDLPTGDYKIKVTYLGYQAFEAPVKVGPNEAVTFDAVMVSASVTTDEVVITASRTSGSSSAVISEIKQSRQVVSGISSQQIQKSQDANAAQVMQRVPGVTIVENRFVMIRGLSERYNQVMINNVVAPSTEVDRRTFSFDLVPSSILDRMLIFKSGTPNLPGDYAGGVIKIFTINDVEKDYVKVSLNTGFRVGTSLRPYFQSQGSPTDFLGFDNGYRQLPSDFPRSRDLQETPRNSQIRVDAANSLPNNWVANESTAPFDYGASISFAKNLTLGGNPLTTINTVSYSTSYQHFVRDFYRYFEWVDLTNPIDRRFRFDDDSYQKDTRVTLLSNWKLLLKDKATITFRNLFNQIGENETILRRGEDFIQRPGDVLGNYLLGYRSRSIVLSQIEGNHDLANEAKLNWVVGGNYIGELEPDLRRFRTFRSRNDLDGPFIMQLPPSSNLFETGRYFGRLNEFTVNHSLNYSKPLALSAGKANLTTGYYLEYRNRGFNSRYVSYLYPGFNDPVTGETLRRLPLDQIFSPENIRTRDGFTLEEGTRNIDTYTANSITTSAYVGGDWTVDRFNISGGFRAEFNRQAVDTRDDLGPITVRNPIFMPMPFLNTAYNLTSSSLIRFGYGLTVNRPEFRELAPFLFYDYKLEAARVGNPNLRPATIQNLDLRYEVYPRVGETFSFGVFYKYFNDPIENKTIVTTEQPTFTYINANYAYNYGGEIEVRRSLRGVTNSKFLDHFSINANASLIWSRVNLGPDAPAQDSVRQLQGQSPYIFNTALYYEDLEKGFNLSFIYNVFGPRIFSIGDVIFPTIYEMPRHSIDLAVTQKVGDHLAVKLGVADLLNAPYRFFQDSDRNERIGRPGLERGINGPSIRGFFNDPKSYFPNTYKIGDDYEFDDVIFSFRRGQLINLTLTYAF